jgi:hypothetical protein
MPVLDGQLARDEGRTPIMAIIDDFEQIVLLSGVELDQAPIVEDKHIDLREPQQHLPVTAIGLGQVQLLQKAR